MRLSFPPLTTWLVCASLSLTLSAQTPGALVPAVFPVSPAISSASGAGVAADAQGNLYLPTATGVAKITSPAYGGGTVNASFITGLSLPVAAAVDAQGDIWVADFTGGTDGAVVEYNSAGAKLKSISITGPVALAASPSGIIWVLNSAQIYSINPANSYSLSKGTSLTGGQAIAVSRTGAVLVGTSTGSVVSWALKSTSSTTLASSSTTLASLGNSVTGLAVDAGGSVYALSNGAITEISAEKITYGVIAGIPSSLRPNVYGITNANFGNLNAPGPASEVALTKLATTNTASPAVSMLSYAPNSLSIDTFGHLLLPQADGSIWELPTQANFGAVASPASASLSYYFQNSQAATAQPAIDQLATTPVSLTPGPFAWTGGGGTAALGGPLCAAGSEPEAVSGGNPPNGYCEIDLTYTPSAVGEQSGPLSVYYSSGGANQTLTLPVFGTGLGSIAAAAPLALAATQPLTDSSSVITGAIASATDPWGNLYLASQGSGGVGDGIYRIANGTATLVSSDIKALFDADSGDSAFGLVFDGAGNLYFDVGKDVYEAPVASITSNVPSYSTHVEIAPLSLSTVMRGLAIDSDGNLYAAGKYSILEIQDIGSSWQVTTLAGTGSGGSTGDGGPALLAQMNTPTALGLDSSGNLYFTDLVNNKVREISGGVIQSVSGLSLTNPFGLALDAGGNLYVGDSTGHLQVLANPNAVGGVTVGPISLAGTGTALNLKTLVSVSLDANGNIYASDNGATGTAVLQELSPSSGASVFGTVNVGANSTNLIALLNMGNQSLAWNQSTAEAPATGEFAGGIAATGTGTNCAYATAIPGGGACITSIVFTPASSGPRVGTIDYFFGASTTVAVAATGIGHATGGTPTTLSFTTLPTGGVAGSTLSSVQVSVLDQNGALVATNSDSITLSIASGPGSFASGTLTVAAVGGVASFNDLVLNNPGSYVLSADDTTSSLTVPSASFPVSAVPQAITFGPLPNKVYGASSFVLSASGGGSSSPVTFAITAGGQFATLSGVNNSTLTITGAGSVTVTASQAAAGIYGAATSVSQSFTITPATLTVSAAPASMTYGQSVPTFAPTYSGFVYSDSPAVLSGTPGLTASYTPPIQAGNYTVVVTVGSLSAANYSFTFVNGTLSVGKAILIPSLTGSVTKTYDGTNTAPLTAANVALAGLQNGDTVAATGLTIVNGTYSDVHAATGKMVVVNGLALTSGNYSLAGTTASGAIGTITPATVTVSLVGPVTKTYDGTTAATLTGANFSFGGVISPDTSASIGFIPGAATYATANAGAGVAVTVGIALSDNDYTLNGVSSVTAPVGTINALSATVSLTGTAAKNYDGGTVATLTPSNFVVSGPINGNALGVAYASAAYDTPDAGSGKIVSVGGITLTGALARNYSLTASSASGPIGTINAIAAGIALSANPASLSYGQNSGILIALTGLSGGQAPAGSLTYQVDSAPAVTVAATVPGPTSVNLGVLTPGSHTVSASYLGGGDYSGVSAVPVSINVAQVATQIVLGNLPPYVYVGGNLGTSVTATVEDAFNTPVLGYSTPIALAVACPGVNDDPIATPTNGGASFDLSAQPVTAPSCTVTATSGLLSASAPVPVVALSAAFPATPVSSTSKVQQITVVYDATVGFGSYSLLSETSDGAEFAGVKSSGTCLNQKVAKSTSKNQPGFGSYAPGDAYSSCTVNVAFTPAAPGLRRGALVLLDANGNLEQTIYLSGIGTGPQVTFAPAAAEQLTLPAVFTQQGIVSDTNGDLFLSSSQGQVIELNGSGFSTQTTLATGLSSPNGMALDGAGNLFVANTGAGNIVEIPYRDGGGFGAAVSVATGFNSPWNVAVDGNGNLFVLDYGTAKVYELPYSGTGFGAQVQLASLPGLATGLAVDANDNVFVAEGNSGISPNVFEIPYANGVWGNASAISLQGESNPFAVALDGNNDLYVADTGNQSVTQLLWNGTSYATQRTLTPNGVGYLDGITVDSAGNIYLSDAERAYATELDVADAPTVTYAPTTLLSTSADSPKAVTAINIGNQPLIINSITYPADFPQSADTNPCLTALAGGATCDLSASFTPTVEGALSEPLALSDNTLNLAGAIQPIMLAGAATPPTPILAVALDPAPGTIYGHSQTADITINGISHGPVPTGTFAIAVDGGVSTSLVVGATSPQTFPLGVLAFGPHTVVVSYSGDSIYAVAKGAINFVITPAPLSVTVNNASRQYGAADLPFTGTLTGVVNADGITASYSAADTATSPVGTPVAITATLADPNGRLGNYTVTNTPGTLTITPETTSVAWTPNAGSIVYGTNLSSLLTATGTDGNPIAYTIAGAPVTAATVQPVGSYTITATLPADANHQTSSNTYTLSVTRAPLSVTANNASRQYGAADPAFTGTLTGVVNADGITASYSAADTATSPVGTPVAITATLADPNGRLGNYTVTNTPGTLTITPETTSVAWTPNAGSIVYGTNLSSLLTATGTDGNPIAYTIAGAPVTAATVQPVGSYTITATLPADANHQTSSNTYTLSVTRAPLSVTVNNASRQYGAADPAFTGTLTGVINADGITASYSAADTATSPVGTPVAITATLADPNGRLGNYTVTNTPGTLTITPETTSVTWTPNAGSIVYGTNLSSLLTATGTDGNPIAYTIAGAPVTAATVQPVGSYTITATLPADANHQTSSNTYTLSVTRAPLSVTVNNASRQYGAADPAFTGTLTGVVNADGITASYSAADTATSPVGTPVAITATLADPNGRLGNYTVTNTPGTLTITPETTSVTWTPNAGSIVYGTNLSSLLTATGTDGNPIAYTIAGAPVTAATVQPVGSYTITATLPADANHQTSSNTYTLSVTRAPLSVTVNNASRQYGAADPAFTGTLTGVVNADGITASYSAADTATSPVGTPVAITATLADPNGRLGNYTVTNTPGTLTITPETTSVTWTPNAGSIVYGTNLASTLTATSSDGSSVVYTIAGQPVNAGTGLAAGTYLITATLPADANHQTSSATYSLTVQPAGNVITFAPLSNLLYGGTPLTVNLSAGASSNLPITWTFSGPATLSGTTLTVNFTGTVTVTASQPGNSNYQAATPVTETFSVGPALAFGLYATATTCNSIALTGNVTIDSFDSSLGAFPAALTQANGNIGTNGNLSLTGNSVVYGALYDPNGKTSGDCDRGPATVSLDTPVRSGALAGGMVPLPAALTYPAPAAPLPAPPLSNQNLSNTCGSMVGCSGLGRGHVALAPGVYGNLTITGNTQVDLSAGTYNFNTLRLSGNSTLNIASGPVVINLAGAQVTGDALDFTGGSLSNSGAASSLDILYAGTQDVELSGGSQMAAVIYTPNAKVTLSGGGSFMGTIIASTISISGDVTVHYDRALGRLGVPGSGVASAPPPPPAPAVLTVTANNLTCVYGTCDGDNDGDDAGHPLTYTVAGFVNGDTATSVLSGAPALSSNAPENAGVGTYTITAAAGSLKVAGNYILQFVPATLTITPANLTIVANSYSRVLHQANPSFGFTVTGFVYGDNAANALTGAPALATGANSSSPAGNYVISMAQGSLAARNGNYTFTLVNGELIVYNNNDNNDNHCDGQGNYRDNPQYDCAHWSDSASYNYYWGQGGHSPSVIVCSHN